MQMHAMWIHNSALLDFEFKLTTYPFPGPMSVQSQASTANTVNPQGAYHRAARSKIQMIGKRSPVLEIAF